MDLTAHGGDIYTLARELGRAPEEILDFSANTNPWGTPPQVKEAIKRAAEFCFGDYDYIVDAIDNVTAKIDLICRAKAAGVPIISSMGTGNKLDPGRFRITDIEKTKVCPLAKVIRKALKKRGVRGVQVLYSEEEPVKTGMRTPASISFVPSAAGLMIAGEVVRYFSDR